MSEASSSFGHQMKHSDPVNVLIKKSLMKPYIMLKGLPRGGTNIKTECELVHGSSTRSSIQYSTRKVPSTTSTSSNEAQSDPITSTFLTSTHLDYNYSSDFSYLDINHDAQRHVRALDTFNNYQSSSQTMSNTSDFQYICIPGSGYVIRSNRDNQGHESSNSHFLRQNRSNGEISTSSYHGGLWPGLIVAFILAFLVFTTIVISRRNKIPIINDVWMMLFIMGSIFMIMSAIAFWLICENFNRNRTNEDVTNESICHHLDSTTFNSSTDPTAGNISISDSNLDPNRHMSIDCPICSISIIESKPPEYYSALKHSVPIGILFENHGVKQQQSEDCRSSDSSVQQHEPPSYLELEQLNAQDLQKLKIIAQNNNN